MGKRVLVTGAGTGATNNLIRSLRAGDPSLFILGCHSDRFVLKKSTADLNYLIPPPTHPGHAAAFRRLVSVERVDLTIPTTDSDVEVLSDLRAELSCHLFLPRPAVIGLCQDKYSLTALLRSHEIPAPETHPVADLDQLNELFRRFPPGSLLWCRARTGSRSLGAGPVANPEQARHWIEYWEALRGIPARAFTLSEYLPGRDFLCQSLWRDGSLVLVKTFERLSYFGGENSPSGVSSLSALAKTVVEPRVVQISTDAVRAIDAGASGAFSIDLKEDANGVPCITEINAGRFFIGMTALDLVGKHNMSLTYLRLAFGDPVELRDEYDAVPDYYLVRDLDTMPGVFHADELFEGIRDARG